MTIIIRVGTYRYSRIISRFQNSPTTVQHAIYIILSGVWWQMWMIYFDDIVLYSKNTKDDMDHVDYILVLLGNDVMKLKLKKFFFFQTNVNNIGHVIQPGRFAVSEDAKDTLSVG